MIAPESLISLSSATAAVLTAASRTKPSQPAVDMGSVDLRFGNRRSAFEKIEIAALVRLRDMLRENLAVAAGVLALAAQIGMATVIEGVEHPAQADELIAMGARLAQGFLFGRPLIPADFTDRLAMQQRANEPTVQPRCLQTVLIVDDDDLMSAMLARHLDQLGYTTVRASCADHALVLARALPPAFAVIDVEMPDVDGWTLIDRIRADEIVDGLQIVIVSGSVVSGHADRAARGGLLFVDKNDRRLRSRLQESIETLDLARQESLR